MWTATQTNREGKKVNLITDTELADSYGKTRVCDLVLSINPQVWLENSLRQRFPGVEWDITISCVAGSKGDPQ